MITPVIEQWYLFEINVLLKTTRQSFNDNLFNKLPKAIYSTLIAHSLLLSVNANHCVKKQILQLKL